MNWKTLVNDKMRKEFNALCDKYPEGPEQFALDVRDYDFSELRSRLLSAENKAQAYAPSARAGRYPYDLEFGLRLYDCLTDLGFGIWEAADNGCWAFISIRVVPDIVYRRWVGYNEDRYYKRNWRIWMKSLWWYIHLTEDGDSDKFDLDASRDLLRNNSEDIIYLLLDHRDDGFRDSLYHMMMKKYHELCESKTIVGNREDFFRAVMVQHTINSMVVDPVLTGEKEYVDAIFDRVISRYGENSK